MALIDFPGEKLVIKLWETLADKGMGALLKPWQENREGKVRLELRKAELMMLAQAEVDANDIRAGRKRLTPENSLELLPSPTETPLAVTDGANGPNITFDCVVDVAYRTQVADAAKSEINISKAILKAEESLASDSQEPPEHEIEDDWISSWREYAGRVSTEDLQQLWGKVLAGEVKAPGTYSLRTLEFMKGLSRAEAEKISTLAQFVVERNILKTSPELFAAKGITFDFLFDMQELGIIKGVDSIGLTTTFGTNDSASYLKVLRFNGKAILIRHEDPKKPLAIETYILTSIGAQILALGSFTPNMEYVKQTGQWIAKQGFKVVGGDWLQATESEGHLTNQYSIEADSAVETVKSSTAPS